jgi:hypothetical protein
VAVCHPGALTGDDGHEIVDTGDHAVQRWGSDFLAAAQELLRGHIGDMPNADCPVQGARLGLHPRADGNLRGPESTALAEQQLAALLRTIGVLGDGDRT